MGKCCLFEWEKDQAIIMAYGNPQPVSSPMLHQNCNWSSNWVLSTGYQQVCSCDFVGSPMKCTPVLVGVLRTTHSTNQPWPTSPSGCLTHLSHQCDMLGLGEFPGKWVSKEVCLTRYNDTIISYNILI